MDIIQNIRRQNGVDEDMLARVAKDPQVAQSIAAMRANLERALESLSEELYSKSTHFLYEFIQNADDNTYADGVEPALHLELGLCTLVIRCNEVGFNKENVEAICKIGASTKKNMSGYIGEKGIGFKSVFKVADVVHISSGPFTFKLDKREALGIITPIWSDLLPVEQGWTTFRLQLSNSENVANLATHLKSLKPSILLFLRRLRSLNIDIAFEGTRRNVKIARRDKGEHITNLERVVDGALDLSQDYHAVTHTASTYIGEAKRDGITQSDIVLAFPVGRDGRPDIRTEEVHAFLPLKNFGFHFMIQADFLTSSSREDILTDSQWNIKLREGVVDAFVRAVIEHFRSSTTLEYVWIQYLPSNIVDPFFVRLQDDIVSSLKKIPIIRSATHNYQHPGKVLTVPSCFCDDKGSPLIPEISLPRDTFYLHKGYNTVGDATHLHSLGVKSMDMRLFVDGLERMNLAASRGDLWTNRNSGSWLEAVCRQLLSAFTSSSYELRLLRPRIVALRILPLNDGSWAAASGASTVVFASALDGIPDDIALPTIKPNIPPSSDRYRLFKALGAKPADAKAVANEILALHRGRSASLRRSSLIQHAKFMFTHRDKSISTHELLVMDDQDQIVRGNQVYMDSPGSTTFAMRNVLAGTSARFIHPDYLKEYHGHPKHASWVQWIKDSLGVNVIPRVIDSDGHLSPEFQSMTKRLNSQILLKVLRVFWSQWELSEPTLSQLSKVIVSCEDDTFQPLNNTSLRRGALKNHRRLHFLPISHPEDKGWTFLREVGVTTEADASLFLKLLFRLQSDDCRDASSVTAIYIQLGARFDDDADSIRKAFEQKPLVFLRRADGTDPGRWMPLSKCFWDGPLSILSKARLKAFFSDSSLREFFADKLGVQNAPRALIVDDLKDVAGLWRDKVLPREVVSQVKGLLCDISNEIGDSPQTASRDFGALRDLAIFPAHTKLGTVLLPLNQLYVPTFPSNHKLNEVFTPLVPLLEASSTDINRLDALLRSEVFRECVRFLAFAATSDTVPSGPPIFDTALTQQFARRVEFFERIIHHDILKRTRNKSGCEQLFTQLHNLKISRVESLEQKLCLESHIVPFKVPSHTECDEHQLSILLSNSDPKGDDFSVIAELSTLLGISKDKLNSVVYMPPDNVRRYLDDAGIAELGTSGASGLSSMESTLSDAYTRPASGPSMGTSSAANEEVLPPILAPIKRAHQIEIGTFDELAQAASQSGPGMIHKGASASFARQDIGDLLRYAPTSAAVTITPTTRKSTPLSDSGQESTRASLTTSTSSSMLAQSRNEDVTEFDRENGIRGECFIYAMLRDVYKLPNFDENNWTSELRGCVPEFRPQEPNFKALADFEYADTRGILTGILYGPDRRVAWKDCWPVYHLEVKSTSGAARLPFHMSAHQMDIALNLATRASDVIPAQVYVLLRVSGVRSPQPSLAIYVDLFNALHNGELRIVSDVQVVLGDSLESASETKDVDMDVS
ncbi:hypothetical protein PLICRDRAFT_173538 [Plicaturopsis crispa FD-325 SS-3]|nr:hypothetical protein PLICRDRAFT_173538 [Plicaturopsis crispa FD-325 SS-3]